MKRVVIFIATFLALIYFGLLANAVAHNSNNIEQSSQRYIILKQDIFFQDQVTQENTIYVIRYEYDLRTAKVKIPKGTTLKFEGGCISNGIVDFSNCNIDAGKNVYIFKNLIDFSNLSECSIKWFGAKGNGVSDDTQVFKFVLDRDHGKDGQSKQLTVNVPYGLYIIKDCINPGAYLNENFAKVTIIGEQGMPVSPHNELEQICGVSRSVIYCKGNLRGTPFIYAPALLKHLTFRGEDNNNRSNYQNFLPKFENTIGISISKQNDYATYRRLEDVQVHFFGTGIEEKDCFGGDWHNVEVYCAGYGVKIAPVKNTITMQTITGLHIAKCKYDGLSIIAPSKNLRCLIHFENLICEHADCLNNPKTPNKENHYGIISNTPISINNGYCENAYNSSDVVNMYLSGSEGDLYTITNFRFMSGTYDFNAPIVISGSLKSYTARFNMHSFRSNIMNVYIERLTGYEKTILHNVTVSSKQANVDKPFVSFSSEERPYWNKMESGEFYYDTDMNQLIYWNGNNWTNLDGVNVSDVKLTEVIGNSAKRKSLKLTAKQIGFRYFDTTLKKPLWWDGSRWVNALGEIVE